jgi:8-oxo-dGTP pyrophosphatase MutT (NUDIX family)
VKAPWRPTQTPRQDQKTHQRHQALLSLHIEVQNSEILTFVTHNQNLHLRAAAIIYHDGFILLNQAKKDRFWALPGGRVEAEKAASNAFIREIQEEFFETSTPKELLHILEKCFTHLGERRHEVGLYFSTSLQENSPILEKVIIHKGIEVTKNLIFKWFNVADLDNTDMRPSFLTALLAAEHAGIRHIVHHANQGGSIIAHNTALK